MAHPYKWSFLHKFVKLQKGDKSLMQHNLKGDNLNVFFFFSSVFMWHNYYSDLQNGDNILYH